MKENKRSVIIESAQELFLQHGYGGTSVLDISKKAGIAKSQIYYYFDTKQDVGDAVIKSEMEYWKANFEDKLMHSNLSPENKLIALILQFYIYNTEKKCSMYQGSLLLNLINEVSTEIEEFRSQLLQYVLSWQHIISDILQHNNCPLPAEEADITAQLIFNLLVGSVETVKVTQSPLALQLTVQHLIHTYVDNNVDVDVDSLTLSKIMNYFVTSVSA